MTTAVENVVNPVSTTEVFVANPSINLDQLGDKAKVVVSNTKAISKTLPIEQLKSMEVARISWETTELAQSNNRLYSILKQAYNFYLVMKQNGSENVRKAQLNAMEQFIAERGYTFTPSTHDMTRVVKCVFGVDRRRVSAYSIALRRALSEDKTADDLIDFLEDEGGVEQIRLGGKKALSVMERATLGKEVVADKVLGTIKLDKKAIKASVDWTDKQVVLVATYLPNGELDVNAVLRHDGAVNAVLAAVYSTEKAAERAAIASDKKVMKALKSRNKMPLTEEQKANKRALKLKQQREFEEAVKSRSETIDRLFTVG